MSSVNRGLLYGIGAYAAWGIFPLYWKMLRQVAVIEVISHRVLWSSVMLLAYVAIRGQAPSLRSSLATPGVVRVYALASALIAVNWLCFIWAVSAGFIVEASLGYFINPLLSMLIGVFVLGERLRRAQWAAVALAATGVLYITVTHGTLPWISLLLATTFATYGLVKKRAPLGSVHGLAVETGLLAIPALAVLVWSDVFAGGAFLHGEPSVDAMLVGAGAVTIAPLLMFASAAQRIPLLWIGILQYIAPTLQLVIGVLVYGEAFPRERAVGFSFVWAALLLFAVDGVRAHRAAAVVPPPE